MRMNQSKLCAAAAGTLGLLVTSRSISQTATPDSTVAEQSDVEPVDVAVAKGILPIPDYTGDLWTRRYISGDWGSARTQLAESGLQLEIGWTQTVQSVTSGGRETGTRYGGSLDYLMNFDLDRMGLVPGALVKFRAESRYGESVNGLAGPLLPVSVDAFFPIGSKPDDDIPFAITNLTYFQYFSDTFGVFVGKFDTLYGDLNPFASGGGVTQFLNANFIFNGVSSLAVPYSTLGAGVIFVPTESVSISSSIMNTADSSTTSGFGEIGDGWTWSTEAVVQYRLGTLPGGQNLGVIYAGDSDYLRIGARFSFQPGQGLVAPTKDDTWAIYWSGWQYLFTETAVNGPVPLSDGAPDIQGFGVFARVGFADQDTNPIEWSASAGVGGRGVIPGRERDLFGIGFYYSQLQTSRLTDAIGLDDASQGLEAFYSITLTPAAALTLDGQWVAAPFPNTDAAIVLALRLNLRF